MYWNECRKYERYGDENGNNNEPKRMCRHNTPYIYRNVRYNIISKHANSHILKHAVTTKNITIIYLIFSIILIRSSTPFLMLFRVFKSVAVS